MLKLNVLDQSPIIKGSEASVSIKQSIELAKLADDLGYQRYWIAEHHDTRGFACASPEIFIPAVASQTNRIRVGSGGVLISHYAPFKIAEQFNMLETLFPGRIDLGIGRAPGGDSKVMHALHTSREDAFIKTNELINYFSHSSAGKTFNSVIASPGGAGIPEIWILGTSPESAEYAARKGFRYIFGSFINDEYMVQCFQKYYQNFVPSAYLKVPYLALALFVICGDNEHEAQRMAKCSEYWLAQTFLRGAMLSFPDEQTAAQYKFSPEERMLIDFRRKSAIISDADTVVNRLNDLAKKFAIHEFTIVTITSNHADRLRSYRLLMERNRA